MQPFSLARKKRRNFHSCISYDTCFWSFLIVHAGKNISHWVNLSYWVDQLKYLPSNRLDKTICTRSSKWVLHIRESISFSFGNCILLDIFYYTMFLYSTRVEKKYTSNNIINCFVTTKREITIILLVIISRGTHQIIKDSPFFPSLWFNHEAGTCSHNLIISFRCSVSVRLFRQFAYVIN